MFVGDDAGSFAKVRSDFRVWIDRQGFREVSAPDALSESAGSKTHGQESTWFISEEPGESPYRIYVDETERQISVGFNSHVVGTDPQYERLEGRIKEFHGKVVEWFQDRPESNFFSDDQLEESLDVWDKNHG